LQTSAIAFHTLKLVGAAYLLWLAWQAFRATSAGNAARADAMSRWQCYRRGIAMNLTNPKVSLFFLAFLPQFADPARGALAAQLVMLGGVFIAATLLVFGAIALAAGSLGKWFAGSPRTQVLLHRSAGAIFVALAVRLASSGR
jgi:threonine/homoserine/homoserine lactone efflux protein